MFITLCLASMFEIQHSIHIYISFTFMSLPNFYIIRMQKVILSKKYGVDMVRFTHTNNAVICASKNGWDGMRNIILYLFYIYFLLLTISIRVTSIFILV